MAWSQVGADNPWNVPANKSKTYGRALVNNGIYLVVTDATTSVETNIVNCQMVLSTGGNLVFADKMLTYFNGFKFTAPSDGTFNFTFNNLSAAAVLVELYEWK
jgi:hypothetical protein